MTITNRFDSVYGKADVFEITYTKNGKTNKYYVPTKNDPEKTIVKIERRGYTVEDVVITTVSGFELIGQEL